MSNPLVHAFFVGRALAETLYEQAEHSLADGMSELGKLDAELRENLRQFTNEVIERANQAEAAAMADRDASATGTTSGDMGTADLQTMIDELRAEVAHLRTALKQYRETAI